MSIFIFFLLSDFQQKSAGTELHNKVVVPGGDFKQRTRRAGKLDTVGENPGTRRFFILSPFDMRNKHFGTTGT